MAITRLFDIYELHQSLIDPFKMSQTTRPVHHYVSFNDRLDVNSSFGYTSKKAIGAVTPSSF